MNIYLIGMMGSGKTTIGYKLSKELNYDFIDLDEVISKKENMSIVDIFNIKGEDYFRKQETNVLKEVCTKKNCVISCGGGIVTKSINLEYMYGLVFYLKTDLNILKTRLENDKTRPLLKNYNLEYIYNSRKNLYINFSDYIISDCDINNNITKIKEIINYPKKNILVVNGPNLNMLEKRNKDNYGRLNLNEINNLINNYDIFNYEFYQTNTEGFMVDKLQTLDSYDGLIINPAAYTHTSIAIRDCLEMFDLPKVEVHLSDVSNREDFRKINYISEVCVKSCTSKHEFSYLDAVNYLKKYFL